MKCETVLPKNIRQIGEIQQDKKVYLEDYVMTFLHKKEKEAQEQGCTGILVGKKEQDDKGSYVFVKGALMLEQEEEGEKRWARAEEEMKQFFPEQELIGCFVMGLLEESSIQDMMGLFPEPPFLIFHIQEGEENVYWSEEKQYQRVGGYFIFYERNPQMQKYMAEKCEPQKVETEEGNSDRAIVSFRQKVKEKSDIRRMGGMRYLASSFFVLTILVLGVTIINNYDKMKEIEEVVARLTAEQNARRLSMMAETGGENRDTMTGQSGEYLNRPENETKPSGETADGSGSVDDTGAKMQITVTGGDGESAEGPQEGTGGQERQTSESDAAETLTGEVSGNDAAETLTGEVSGNDAAETLTGEVSGSDAAATLTGEVSGNDAAEVLSGAAGSDSSGHAENRVMETLAEIGGNATAAADTALAEDSALSDFADTIAAQSLKERNYSAENPEKTDEILEAASRQNRSVYTIRYGDTLADISQKYYGSLEKIDEICRLNGIDDANKIVPGEKIVLP